MQLFVLTTHCTSRIHCKVCRNKEGGRRWRTSLTKAYTLPVAPQDASDPTDFECPFGLPWIESTAIPESPKRVEQLNTAKSKIQRNTGSRGGGCGCSRGK